jgi:5,10-methylenetetrahydrofolate reductase
MQMTTRDRNRIALQADMLAASVMGIKNLVLMGGDPPHLGDHPEAKPVFDLATNELIGAASGLNAGKDFAGNDLLGSTDLHIGAVVKRSNVSKRKSPLVQNFFRPRRSMM